MHTAEDRLLALLERLDRTFDPMVEAALDERHLRAVCYEPVDRLPVVIPCAEPLPEELAPYPLAEAFADPAKMLWNELGLAWQTSIARRHLIGDDLPATVRANFGTVLVASCFGGTVEQHGENPPWVRHFGSREEFARAVESTEVAATSVVTSPLVERAVEFMEYYREVLGRFDTLGRVVKVTIPDLQGPLDNAAMLRGSGLFIDALDDPAFFNDMLGRMAEAQVALWRRFQPLAVNEPDGFVHQHGVMVRGNILIRNDSTVMVSPDLYRDQVAPHDERVMRAIGGGAIHSCGCIDHVVPVYLEGPSLRSVDYGQSQMNDVDAHYAAASGRRVALVRVVVTREELVTGTVLDRFPTGVVLLHRAETVAEAQRTMSAYVEAAARRA